MSYFKELVLSFVVKYLANHLTDEVLKDWAGKARGKFIEWTDELFDRLEIEAKKTDTLIDDIAVQKARKLRDYFVPTCEIEL